MPICTSCGVSYPNDCIHITDDGKRVCCYCMPKRAKTVWTTDHKGSPPEKIEPIPPKENRPSKQEREIELLEQLKQTKTRPIEGQTKQSDLEDFFGT